MSDLLIRGGRVLVPARGIDAVLASGCAAIGAFPMSASWTSCCRRMAAGDRHSGRLVDQRTWRRRKLRRGQSRLERFRQRRGNRLQRGGKSFRRCFCGPCDERWQRCPLTYGLSKFFAVATGSSGGTYSFDLWSFNQADADVCSAASGGLP